tara:strand:+ start:892 stop:2079 length:1188 start_codon:yes stop_codon:yes gene_type:complete
MKFYYNSIKLFAVSMLVATNFSCSSDDDSPSINGPEVTAPDTYVFERQGESTVIFGGQTDRLEMAASLFNKLNDENVDELVLLEMFNEGTGFYPDASITDAAQIAAVLALNIAGKRLENKTAAYGDSSVMPKIAGFLTEYANSVSTNFLESASAGVAGTYVTTTRTVRVNDKGMELNQVFAKSLIGALVMDQVAYGYLSEVKIGDGVENVALEDGKNYTKMEHHFDEGFGYVYGQESDITTAATPQGNGILFNKYLKKVDADNGEEPGLGMEIYDAFKLGRAAIVAGNSSVRDAQAEIVKTKMSRVILHKAAYYLRYSAAALDATEVDYSDYFHSLSEGYGFILSLQFTYDADGMNYFSHSEVEVMLSTLESGDGFWDRTATELNDMAAQIEAKL